MNSVIKIFFLWLGLTIVAFVAETVTFSTSRYERFLIHGVKVEGVVEEKQPYNHQAISYSYVVDGTKYTGIGASDIGTPPFDVIQVGTKIVVFYDKDEPQKSIPGEPALYVQKNSNHPYFLTLFAPFLVLWGLYRKGWI